MLHICSHLEKTKFLHHEIYHHVVVLDRWFQLEKHKHHCSGFYNQEEVYLWLRVLMNN